MANTMEYKGYHATIDFSMEDNLLIGSVIGVQDSLNFHGHSVAEITDSFHSCIDTYLQICRELNREPDKEYKGSFNVRIAPQLHRNADIAAKRAGISLNQFVQEAIEDKVCGKTSVTYVTVDTAMLRASNGDASTPGPENYKDSAPLYLYN